jgi:hypothetical protein
MSFDDEKENTSCSCVTFDNKGCIFENICPDYIGKPSTFNRACLTLSEPQKTQQPSN